jgi:hypothetical protein
MGNIALAPPRDQDLDAETAIPLDDHRIGADASCADRRIDPRSPSPYDRHLSGHYTNNMLKIILTVFLGRSFSFQRANGA